MQHLRNSVLKHVRLSCSTQLHGLNTRGKSLFGPIRCMSLASNNSGSEHLMARVIELVKKFDKIDASKLFMSIHTYVSANFPSSEPLMDHVIELAKKFSQIDASKVFVCHEQGLLPYVKVTETADFQKDLCLDSLDRVELVMAFEQEFSIEIPDEKADKLSCCADVVKYILSETQPNNIGSS